MNASVLAFAQAARSSSSCGWIVIDRPPVAVVRLCRSGQAPHAAPKVTVRLAAIARVTPAGQVTVPV